MTSPTSHSLYATDDARIATTSLEFLHTLEGTKLLASIAALLAARSDPTVADVASFRKHFPAEIVHAAFAIARRKAEPSARMENFPTSTSFGVFPKPSSKPVTPVWPATRRLALLAAESHAFHRLCAGIGGDTFALRRRTGHGH